MPHHLIGAERVGLSWKPADGALPSLQVLDRPSNEAKAKTHRLREAIVRHPVIDPAARHIVAFADCGAMEVFGDCETFRKRAGKVVELSSRPGHEDYFM